MIFLPVLFTIVLPSILILIALVIPQRLIEDNGGAYALIVLLKLSLSYNQYLIAAELIIKWLILPFFLFVPAFLPAIIASDSFAGEKERKTMESLALLPISKTELIIGKVLVSLIPSLLISFAYFLLIGTTVNLMLLSNLDGNILIFTDNIFLLIVFLLSPLLTMFNVIIATIISSRSKDMMKSVQISNTVLIGPVIVLMLFQIVNPAFLSPLIILILSGVLGGLCILLIYIANRVLNIEKLILML